MNLRTEGSDIRVTTALGVIGRGRREAHARVEVSIDGSGLVLGLRGNPREAAARGKTGLVVGDGLLSTSRSAVLTVAARGRVGEVGNTRALNERLVWKKSPKTTGLPGRSGWHQQR